MAEHLIVSREDELYRQKHDTIKWDGGKVIPRAIVKHKYDFVRCKKCTLRRMAAMKRCPACGEVSADAE